MKILDIGCNGRKFKGYDYVWCDGRKYGSAGSHLHKPDTVIGLDIHKFPEVDVVHDLEKAPLPFEDESFDMVYSKESFEHVHNRVQLLGEIWRILKPNGIFKVIVPHHTNPIGKRPEHHGYFSMQSFEAFVPEEKEKYITGRFLTVERKIKLMSPFSFLEGIANRYPDFYEWRLSWFIPAIEVSFELKKVKE